MKQKEVMEKLNISRQTLLRYRKTLGIVEETKKEISKKQFELLKNLKNNNSFMYKEERDKVLKGAEQFEAKGLMEIKATDCPNVKTLKCDYNNNRKFIEYLQSLLDKAVENKKLPPKLITNMLERYQMLNLKIITVLSKMKAEKKDIGALISERLEIYK